MSKPSLPRSVPAGVFHPGILARLNAVFPDAYSGWMMLSICRYNWRAHLDVAEVLKTAAVAAGSDNPDKAEKRQHLVMGMLEQLFEEVDVFWRLIAAVRCHREGRGFIHGYCSDGERKDAIAELETADDGAWAQLLKDESPTATLRDMRSFGVSDDDAHAAGSFFAALPARLGMAARELKKAFDTPQGRYEGGKTPIMSLRDVNNVYRHGTRVLFESCVPRPVDNIPLNPHEREGMCPPVEEVLSQPPDEYAQLLEYKPNRRLQYQTGRFPTDDATIDRIVLPVAELADLIRDLAVWFVWTAPQPPEGASPAPR